MKKLSDIKMAYVTFHKSETYKDFVYDMGKTYIVLDVPRGYLDRCVRIGATVSEDKVDGAIEDVRPDSFLNDALKARENKEKQILEKIEKINERRKLVRRGLKAEKKPETVLEEKEEVTQEEKNVEQEQVIEKEVVQEENIVEQEKVVEEEVVQKPVEKKASKKKTRKTK